MATEGTELFAYICDTYARRLYGEELKKDAKYAQRVEYPVDLDKPMTAFDQCGYSHYVTEDGNEELNSLVYGSTFLQNADIFLNQKGVIPPIFEE